PPGRGGGVALFLDEDDQDFLLKGGRAARGPALRVRGRRSPCRAPVPGRRGPRRTAVRTVGRVAQRHGARPVRPHPVGGGHRRPAAPPVPAGLGVTPSVGQDGAAWMGDRWWNGGPSADAGGCCSPCWRWRPPAGRWVRR